MSLIPFLSRKRGKSLFLPAHGRGLSLPNEMKSLLSKRAGVWDLPDLVEIGGPLEKDGIVAQSQREAAAAMGADRCWFGVNGATGLLQAALLSIAAPGTSVLMPRNVHRSLIQACVLADLNPVFFGLPFLSDRGHFYTPDKSLIQALFEKSQLEDVNISAAVLVNPTYQGYSTSLRPLIDLFHQRGWPVLVDEAHGAHFAVDLDIGLPDSAINLGADLIVHSLHKSALGLVQSAVLWSKGDRVDPDSIETCLSWLQTSSPSSLLLASCESALKEWRTTRGLMRLRNRIEESKILTNALVEAGLPLLKNDDPLKLILHTSIESISGIDADKWLSKRSIEAELPEPGCLTFCLGYNRQRSLAKLLTRLWNQLLDSDLPRTVTPEFNPPPSNIGFSTPCMHPGIAWRSKRETLDLSQSIGRISAQLICPYPPGIPLLIPGEKLDKNLVEWLLEQKRLWPEQISAKIDIVKDQ